MGELRKVCVGNYLEGAYERMTECKHKESQTCSILTSQHN